MPSDLRTTSDNPVFGEDAANRYSQEYYRQAIQPQVDQERIAQQQSGNGDSTYGATAVSNLQARGSDQAFFSGEDYRNQLINQTLARRDSLFGNEGRIAENQNALDIQRGLGVEGIDTQRLGMLNQANLGEAGILGGMYSNKQQLDQQAAQAKAAQRANLIGGLFGLGGGLANTFMGGGRSSTPTGINNGANLAPTMPSAPTGDFGSLSPYFTNVSYTPQTPGFQF